MDRIVLYKSCAAPKIALTILDAQGQPRDLTGWTISIRLGYLGRAAADHALVTWTTTGGDVALTDPAAGELEVAYATADLATIPPGTSYTVEAKRTDSGAEEVLGQLPCEVRESLHQ